MGWTMPIFNSINTNGFNIKKGQIRKPGSVLSCHLSRSAFTNRLYQPTRCSIHSRRNAYWRAATLLQPIWSFSPQGFPTRMLPYAAWALTSRFHPYPYTRYGRYIFCGTFRGYGIIPEPPPVRRCGALRCPDFPHPANSGTRQVDLPRSKGNLFMQRLRMREKMREAPSVQ